MMNNEKTNYLGIDWGASKVGVAVAHAETALALAYRTLQNDADLVKHLGEIIKLEEIGTVVIGKPAYVHHKEEESPQERFGSLLLASFPLLQVEYQDEMFTSSMAQINLIERGDKMVSKHDDAEAARIILQTWLDRQNS